MVFPFDNCDESLRAQKHDRQGLALRRIAPIARFIARATTGERN
jgi:hypothetical protein